MELNDYQKRAMKTCMPSCHNGSYMLLNLVGEVGEFAGKIAKGIRKKDISIGVVYGNIMTFSHNKDAQFEELKKEAGDILWQLSGLCYVLGWNLEDIAQMNLDKLASRKERGVIDGDGDNR